MADSKSSKTVTPDAVLEYVLTWFTYHASQRIQTFNFFLIIQGGLFAIYLGLAPHESWQRVFTAVLGLVTVVAFLLLEVRNTELVNAGRAGLDEMERAISDATVPKSKRPRQRDLDRSDLALAARDFRLWPLMDEHKVERLWNFLAVQPREKNFAVAPRESTILPITIQGGGWRDLRFLARHSFVFRIMFFIAGALWLVGVGVGVASRNGVPGADPERLRRSVDVLERDLRDLERRLGPLPESPTTTSTRGTTTTTSIAPAPISTAVAGNVRGPRPPPRAMGRVDLGRHHRRSGRVREGIRVPELDSEECNRSLRIMRRSSAAVVTWRRAQTVLLSSQGMDAAQGAKVASTSQDRVRAALHNFDDGGFDALYPKRATSERIDGDGEE